MSKENEVKLKAQIEALNREVAKLKDVEARYRAFFNSTNDMIDAHRPTPEGRFGKFIDVNDRFCELLGYTREEMLELTVRDISVDVITEENEKAFVKNIIDRKSILSEGVLATKDGRHIPVELSTHAFELEGQVTFISVVRDVTERKQMEKALKDSEAKYRAFFNSTNDMIVAHRPTTEGLPGKFIEVNDRACQILGYTREELLELSPKNIAFLPVDMTIKEQKSFFKNIIDQKSLLSEAILVTKDGRHIAVEISTKFLELEGQATILSVLRDVTERKQMEKALKDSEARFRAFFNSTNDMIDAHRPTPEGRFGKFIDVNDRFCELLGYTREEMLKLTPRDISVGVITEENEKAFVKSMIDRKSILSEGVLATKDGRYIPVELSTHAFELEGQTTILSVVRDVTERKEAEAKIKQMNDALSRSNEELERFAYVASHDMQEPLRMVASYTQLLERRYKDKLDEDANEFIHFAVDGASRMQTMINDLLTYSRVSSKGKEFKPTDLTVVLDKAKANLRLAIEESGTVIKQDSMPDNLMADESQLVQLFQNLMGNAIKFREKGKKPNIEVKANKKGKEWLFSISDDGIGIKEGDLSRIFQVFQRSHGKEYPGTGIGLSVTKRIVERHGGRIWVESAEGKGSTFYFTIPLEAKGQ